MTIEERINRRESFIIADDKQYLGKLCLNKYDVDSILNVYGPYGSPYSPTSINNKYSTYGSPYSSLSPHNPYTITPPTIYLRGVKSGRLSVNKFLFGCVDPRQIQEWMIINKLYY